MKKKSHSKDINHKIHYHLENEYKKKITGEKISSYRISDCGPPWVGAMLSHMVHCMNVSYHTGHELRVSSIGGWKMNPGGKFSDVFDYHEIEDHHYPVNDFSTSTRISYKEQHTKPIPFCSNRAYFHPETLKEILDYDDKLVLNDIWKSFLLKKIYKLTPKYDKLVKKEVNKIKNLHNYAAIHIRRGDKVFGKYKESHFIETKTYFEKLENSNYEFESIFISTDSPEALDECLFLYANKYNIIYDIDEIRHDGYPLKVDTNTLNLEETCHDELVTALKNFHILKNSNVLVGTPASWFFRISMLLRDYDKIHDVIYAEDLNNIPGYPEYYYHC